MSRPTNGGMAATSSAKRAALYVRVSTAKQEEDGTSLETQEERCRAYATQNGYKIANVYRETHSGADLFHRPFLTQLRAAIREGEVDVVVAYAIDRLTRNQAHLGLILSEADYAGIAIEFVTERLEDTPEGRLLQSVRAFSAELERLKIAERTGRGRRARATMKGCLIPGPRPIYGYRWVEEFDRDKNRPVKARLEFDSATASIVRRIFDEAAAGRTLRSIALGLTADGIPTATGRAVWSITTLTGILANEAYTGVAVAFRLRTIRTPGKPTRTIRLAPEEQIPLPDGVIPRLIDPATFLVVRDRLARNKAESVRNNHDPEATLLRSGFVRCGHCGCAMRVIHQSGRGPSYRHAERALDRYGCPAIRMSARDLDRKAWRRVEFIMKQRDVIRGEIERLRSSPPPAEANLAALDRRLADIAQRQLRIGRAIASLDDEASTAPLLIELRTLATHQRELAAERSTVEASHASWQTEQVRLDDFAAWCERVEGNLAGMTYQDRRDLLTALNFRATVYESTRTPRVEFATDLGPLLYDASCC